MTPIIPKFALMLALVALLIGVGILAYAIGMWI
jgi:hypothetical protein